MQTDLLLMPFGATYSEMREAAVAAEHAGFDGIWTWDHLRDAGGDSGQVPECLTVLTALAEVVPRVMLGSLVLNVANRHPGLLANMAATLQQVSGNRFLLGIGAGGGGDLPYAAEQTMRGLPVPPDPVRRQQVAEAVQVIKRLWAGDRSDFDGRHYQLRRPSGFPRPAVPPPLIVGGFGPKMAAVAGRYADGFNAPAGAPDLERLIDVARRECAASGRDPADFLITVFAGMSERLLRQGGGARAALGSLGVQRLILLLSPPYDRAAIRDAGALLGPV